MQLKCISFEKNALSIQLINVNRLINCLNEREINLLHISQTNNRYILSEE